jgi:hypothetical protein
VRLALAATVQQRARPPHRHEDRLGDFTANARLLILTPMAAVVGIIGALVAVALVWLIGAVTNLAYFHRFASDFVSPARNQLGPMRTPRRVWEGTGPGAAMSLAMARIRLLAADAYRLGCRDKPIQTGTRRAS